MEEIRRRQLIEATIASIHDVGFSESSVSRIAAKAGVSAGIVHHYFEDKGELLEATLRQLGANLSASVIRRLRTAKNAAHRLMAVVDGNLGPELFTPEAVSAWLAFWSQVPTHPNLARIQTVIIRRLHSNLVGALHRGQPPLRADRRRRHPVRGVHRERPGPRGCHADAVGRTD